MFKTLYHTIPTFNEPKNEAFWKHCRKKEKMLVTSIFSFSTMFSTLSKTEIIIWATFILSSANAFNLVTSRILSFGKELKNFADENLKATYMIIFLSKGGGGGAFLVTKKISP